MIEYITQNFNFITYTFELIAALVGLFCFKKYKNYPTKYFIYFLSYIFFVEIIGALLIYTPTILPINLLRSLGFQITIWYNVFWFFGSILFILFYFHSILKLKQFKFSIRVVGFLFSIIMLGHFIIYSDVFKTSHPIRYQFLGLLATFICIAFYFIEFLKSNSILNIFRTFGFYASVGLVLWWLIITPVIFFDFYNTVSDWDFVNLKRRIFLFANIFMYTCFTVGLILSKPIND